MNPQIPLVNVLKRVIMPVEVGYDDLPKATPQLIRVVRLSTGLTYQKFPREVVLPSRDWTRYEALDKTGLPIPLPYWHACLYATSNGSESLLKAAKALNESLYRRAASEAKQNHVHKTVLEYLKREHQNGNTNIYYINVRLHLLLQNEPAPYKALRDAEGVPRSRLKGQGSGRGWAEDKLAAIREQRALIKEQRDQVVKQNAVLDVQLAEAQALNEIAQRELAAKRLELAYEKRYTRNKKP
jgi:hypothetical protein